MLLEGEFIGIRIYQVKCQLGNVEISVGDVSILQYHHAVMKENKKVEKYLELM